MCSVNARLVRWDGAVAAVAVFVMVMIVMPRFVSGCPVPVAGMLKQVQHDSFWVGFCLSRFHIRGFLVFPSGLGSGLA